MRCGSRSLRAESRSSVSARCAPRFVPGDGVDLVDDHGLDAREDLAGLGGEDQVQRLGRRDEDVRRRAAHRGALALGRVAGAHGDLEVGADPAQRRAEVAVDVVAERLERRDVDEARVVGRFAAQTVEAPEERGERLAAAGRGGDEHVLAAGDRRPRLRLGGRGSFERALEPVADGGREGGERRRRHLGRGYSRPGRTHVRFPALIGPAARSGAADLVGVTPGDVRAGVGGDALVGAPARPASNPGEGRFEDTCVIAWLLASGLFVRARHDRVRRRPRRAR